MKIFSLALALSLAGCLDGQRRTSNRGGGPPKDPVVHTGRELNTISGNLPRVELNLAQLFCNRLREAAKEILPHPGVVLFFKVRESTFEGKTFAHDRAAFSLLDEHKLYALEDPQDPAPYKGEFFEYLENGKNGQMAWVCTELFPATENGLPQSEVNRWQEDPLEQKLRVIHAFMTPQNELGMEWKLYSKPSRSNVPLMEQSLVVIVKNSGTPKGKLVRQDWVEYNEKDEKRTLSAELVELSGI